MEGKEIGGSLALNTSLKRLSGLFSTGQPDAVIWDMDGVLCATMDLHFQALRMACTTRNLIFPEEITSSGVGRTDRANLNAILSQNDIPVESSENPLISVLLKEKENILFGLLQETQLKTSPGVDAWLEVLERKQNSLRRRFFLHHEHDCANRRKIGDHTIFLCLHFWRSFVVRKTKPGNIFPGCRSAERYP